MRVHRVALTLTLMLMTLAGCQTRGPGGEQYFATSRNAADAIINACRFNDDAAIRSILGAANEQVYDTTDRASDQLARTEFANAAEERLTLHHIDPDTVELIVGHAEWPMPVHIIRETAGWRFDTAGGAQEILDRRVGRNELAMIDVCRQVLVAQEWYCDRDPDGDGSVDYADRFRSTPGKRDGLYWRADPDAGIEPSPLHDFVEDHSDYLELREEGDPYRGYYVRILKRQGPAAPDGAMDYEVSGRLQHGFALLAWPSDYAHSGIMTFMISHHGTLYERDLGPDTAEIAATLHAFDPDDAWTIVP